jgi:uncharacterized protein (TIGR02266 family)
MPNREKHEKRNHFRGKARPGRRVNVRYRRAADSEGEFAQAVTANIGVGGAYILSREPEPVGTELCILVQVPTDEQDIEVKGEVRWISSGAGGERAGMGIKFLDLDVHSLLKLSEYFASLTGTEP